MHTTTNHSPIEIMSNVKDENMLDEVRENTKKNQGNIKKWEHYLLKKEENTYQQLDKDRQQEIFIYSYLNPTIKSKSFAKQSWFIIGKVIEEKRNTAKKRFKRIRANIIAYRKVRLRKYTSMRLSLARDKFSVNC